MSPVQIARSAKCQEVGAFIPTMRPGMEKELADLLDVESRTSRSGMVPGGRAQQRMNVFDSFNHKLNEALSHLVAAVTVNTPVRFNPDGNGVTIWLKKPDIEVADLLELRFSPSPSAPWPVHCFGRVAVVKVDANTNFTRVTCKFVKVNTPTVAVKKRVAKKPIVAASKAKRPMPKSLQGRPASKPKVHPVVSQPVAKSPVVIKQAAPTAANLVKPQTAQLKKELPKKPEIKSTPAPISTAPPRLPTGQPAHVTNKYEEMLKKGLDIASAEVKATKPPPPPKSTADNESRQNFRINDRIPFVWSIVSQETFERECLPPFETKLEFGLRKRIMNQQLLLKEFYPHFEILKRTRPKVRKNAVWIHEHLSWLFLRASTENEEEYYQGLTALFLNLIKAMNKPLGRAERRVMQLMSQFKSQFELQRTRDEANPITEIQKLNVAQNSLTNLHRQSNKMIAELESLNPEIGGMFKLFKELVDTINLTLLDRPVGVSPDGKDLFTVNLSATGLAFRTRRLFVKKGDLLEMRIFLSTGGERFQPVNCYGKVVFVQGPTDSKLKIATHIDPIPREFEANITTHIARRQREILAEKAELKEQMA